MNYLDALHDVKLQPPIGEREKALELARLAEHAIASGKVTVTRYTPPELRAHYDGVQAGRYAEYQARSNRGHNTPAKRAARKRKVAA